MICDARLVRTHLAVHLAHSDTPSLDITDPTTPAEPSAFERWVDARATPYLVDKRDVVFTRLVANIVTQLMPLTLLMFLVPTVWALALAVPYVAYLFIRFGGPVVLGLHAVTHRPLFKKRYRRLDVLMTHVVPVFFGLPPFAYRSHHVRMHHTEENSEDDLSGTGAYQRDNIWHFLHYWARFTFFGYWHLASWLIRGGKGELARNMLLGDLAIYALMGVLTFLNPVATAIVFWIPFAMLRFFLMAGNWTEHAFVDVDNPTDAYSNSTNLLNTPYNHRAYNAGYHMIHHVVPGLHWADTVPYFRKNLDMLVAHDAILFDGIRNNQQIWWRLMRHDYGYLADHLLDLDGRRPTREAKIAFLQSRVKPTVGVRKGLVERRERGVVAAAV